MSYANRLSSIPEFLRRPSHKRTPSDHVRILESILQRDEALFARLPPPKERQIKYPEECEGEYYLGEEEGEEEEEEEEAAEGEDEEEDVEQTTLACGQIPLEPKEKVYPLDLTGIDSIVPVESVTALTKEQFEKQHRANYELSMPKFYFTAANVKDFKEAFECFDTYSIGYMKTNELFLLLRCLDFHPDKIEIKHMLEIIDPKRAGLLSFGDFIRVIEMKLEERDDMKNLERGFRDMDLDSKGRINAENITRVGQKLKKEINLEEVMEMIHYADQNKESVVEKFKKALNRRTIYEK